MKSISAACSVWCMQDETSVLNSTVALLGASQPGKLRLAFPQESLLGPCGAVACNMRFLARSTGSCFVRRLDEQVIWFSAHAWRVCGHKQADLSRVSQFCSSAGVGSTLSMWRQSHLCACHSLGLRCIVDGEPSDKLKLVHRCTNDSSKGFPGHCCVTEGFCRCLRSEVSDLPMCICR